MMIWGINTTVLRGVGKVGLVGKKGRKKSTGKFNPISDAFCSGWGSPHTHTHGKKTLWGNDGVFVGWETNPTTYQLRFLFCV